MYRYADVEIFRNNLWGKVIFARSVEAVRAWFVGLFESNIPDLLKRRLQYWYAKIDRWGGPHIKRFFTANFKGAFIIFVCCAVP